MPTTLKLWVRPTGVLPCTSALHGSDTARPSVAPGVSDTRLPFHSLPRELLFVASFIRCDFTSSFASEERTDFVVISFFLDSLCFDVGCRSPLPVSVTLSSVT